MVSTVYSAGLNGIDGYIICAECSCSGGLPGINIIGLPDNAVKEALSRVESALKNNGYSFVKGRTIINLAPADTKKEGSSLDLAILLSLLCHAELSGIDLAGKCFIGELSLTGEVRRSNGVLPMCLAAKQNGFEEVYLPVENCAEASLVDGIKIYGVSDIKQLVSHLKGERLIQPTAFDQNTISAPAAPAVDFSDIKGQIFAKHAAEVAAAGGHNLLLIGPPGSGKSMISKAIPGILPQMTYDEMLEVTKIHSVAGMLDGKLINARPFRSPHHTVSLMGLAGGGSSPHPGELSLAHNGVLFMDELPQFEKRVLETMRQPLEDGKITIVRVKGKVTFPADFMLVCAMNPCPCGHYGDPHHPCKCSDSAISNYLGRLSGPLLDRIDMQIEVPAVSYGDMTSTAPAETSAQVRERVNRARQMAINRFGDAGVNKNADADGKLIRQRGRLTQKAASTLETAFEKLNLSARGYDRVLRMARTVADLDNSEDLAEQHVLEALQYRAADKKYFNR